ncbi:glycosyltransferase family 4 protein [Vibrio sp. St2]|uniref:glycosyltransferase family 4 protein n=1 Tax=Vibrio sp. St2 TaxID=2853441 RepID=UPI00248F3C19|nr:glycosyltransferase family 4 protein [Vibrio sp. St2]
MQLLFLTDNFPPEGNAPASRTYEHAAQWIKEGHEVTVITCAPNFPEGKVYKGYKNKLYDVSYMDGIRVVRVKTYITANEGFLKRILDYQSFMVTGFIAGLFHKKPDLVIATSPQFFCACAGWALSAVKRVPFVFELRDIWPASITAVGAMKDSYLIQMLEKLELFLYHRADCIISVTHSFKKELVARGVDSEKIGVVLNGVDLSRYKRVECKDSKLAQQYDLEGKFVVGYVGTHGMAHGLEGIIDVAEMFQGYDDIRFVFAGGGAAKEKVITAAQKKNLRNVVFIDRQPKEMMPQVWSLCDVSLVPLINNPLFETVIPSKIFECMAMGLPVIMSVPKGEATEIVEKNNTGIVVEPECKEGISNAIMELYRNPDKKEELKQSSIKSSRIFNREVLANKMLNILAKLS